MRKDTFSSQVIMNEKSVGMRECGTAFLAPLYICATYV